MYSLNNLDITILAVVVISALIALNRGLIKEVLSIVGWVLSTLVIVYMLPVCLPYTKKYIENGILAGVTTSLILFVTFFVVWIYSTSNIIGKIRTSKLTKKTCIMQVFFSPFCFLFFPQPGHSIHPCRILRSVPNLNLPVPP